MKLDDIRLGQKVIYRPYPEATPEEGVVTEIRHVSGLVMVRYGSDVGSKATRRHDLEPLRAGEDR